MEQYLPVLLVLACPVGMGVMMWFMMRGQHRQHSGPPSPAQQEEIAILRAEIAALRDQRPRSRDGHDSTGTQQ